MLSLQTIGRRAFMFITVANCAAEICVCTGGGATEGLAAGRRKMLRGNTGSRKGAWCMGAGVHVRMGACVYACTSA